jgi:hypothetical protein
MLDISAITSGQQSFDEFLTTMMDWHFSRATGSKFWLDRLGSLKFDPIYDVRTHADLRLFPNVVNELRNVPVADLIPRGYHGSADIVGVYESGGTTGTPKQVPLCADWMRNFTEWTSLRMDELDFPTTGNWLALAPSGPHIFGRVTAELVRLRRSTLFGIDLDPRWVRKCLHEVHHEEAERYTEHLVDQAGLILHRQPIDVLVVTPPLLERMLRREEIVTLIRKNVRSILWGGAHLDPDTRHILRTEVFPEIGIHGMYGSTMILGGSMERRSPVEDFQCVFDAFSPGMTFSVVDPVTQTEVAEGERGQVVMHHLSKALLLPNNLERDLATRIAAPPGVAGASVADVAPMPDFENTTVIEGVY